jgi:UTP--glucose-1-phosphate uridylyltransferase
MPKEMLPIIDKPIIQIAVEELVAAGVTDIIIVTGSQKRAIEDHFDRDMELEALLHEKGKSEAAKQIQEIAELANFVYLRQKGTPKGNARPVLNAAHLLGDEPFFVYFPDDFFSCKGTTSAQQMITSLEAYGSPAPVLSLVDVSKEEVTKYGVIDPGAQVNDNTYTVNNIIEKPAVDEAPSTLASVNGYILTPEVIPYLENLEPDAKGEISIAAGLQQYAKDHAVIGSVIDGTFLDCGNKAGYLEAIMHAAKRDKDLQPIINC